MSEEERTKYRDIGLDSIANGEVAVILMAGGQGTRLGCSGPKGEYDIGLLSHKCLFQLHAERLIRAEEMAYQKTGKSEHSSISLSVESLVYWYVMTSPMTHADTLSYILVDHPPCLLHPTFLAPLVLRPRSEPSSVLLAGHTAMH